MFDPATLVRPNIMALSPYQSARDEYSSREGVFLDANENPYGKLNRYPDPWQRALKQRLSTLKNLPAHSVFTGNGSDEIIDLLFRVFCRPGEDHIVLFPPTYGMYEVLAVQYDVGILKIPLTSDFQLDFKAIEGQWSRIEAAKILFLCSPNNPTGNSLNKMDILLQTFKGIVVIDEAYIDFSNTPSFIQKLDRYPNLVVLQTLSKAWGLAGARIGIAYASGELLGWLNKVKAPYNISTLNQKAALKALQRIETINKQIQTTLKQRTWLAESLAALPNVRKVYPSDANFLLVEVWDAPAIYRKLLDLKVIVRNRHSEIPNCLRITVGKPPENRKLIQLLKSLL